jgi:predicted nucleic acid-binding protein
VTVGLDTSVFVRLLVGQPQDQFERAEAYLDELHLRGDQAVISDLVVAETYFALQYHYQISKADALAFIARAFESGDIKPNGVAPAILKTPALATAKPGFVDRLIHAEYLKQADEIATFEKAASKLKSVRVL